MDIPELQDIDKLCSFGNVSVSHFAMDTKNDKIFLYGKLTDLRCSECGSAHVSKRSHYTRKIADRPLFGKPTTLIIETSRVHCHNMMVPHEKKQDGLTPKIDGIPVGARVTPRLKELLANEDFSKCTFKSLEDRYGVSITTVIEVFDEKIAAVEPLLVYPECTMIGIDEVHLGEHGKSNNPIMCGTIVDMSNPDTRLIDILKRNNKDLVVEAFGKFPSPEKIKWVCMDMHRPYVAAVEECFPQAKIIVDRFHVEAQLEKAVNDSLRRITAFYENNYKSLSDPVEREEQLQKFRARPFNPAWFHKKQSTYKAAIKLLEDIQNGSATATKRQIKAARQSCAQFQKLMTLCRTYQEYDMVVRVHNDFVAMFEQDTREEAEKAFYAAVSELPNKKLKDHILAPFWDYVKTVENWKDMILNYFDAAYEPHRSNGPVEQWNRNINRVFNDGNGYSFKHLREKMLLGNDKIKLSEDFKFVPASTNHVYTALSAYAGAEGDYSEQTMQYLHSIVRGIAKTPEMKGNTFVAEVVKNIEAASFSMLREVLVTYPSLSFRVAEELDDHLSAQGRVEILGVSLDEFNATYDYIRAQINAHLEDESILTPPRSFDVEDPDEEDDFNLSEDF